MDTSRAKSYHVVGAVVTVNRFVEQFNSTQQVEAMRQASQA